MDKIKIYLRPQEYDYRSNGPQGTFLFEMPINEFVFNSVIKYNHRDYYLKPCCASVEQGWCEVEEVKFEDLSNDASNYDESQVICPVCGYHLDEIDPRDDEVECPNCGAQLQYEAQIVYSTSVKELPKIKEVCDWEYEK